MAACTRLRQSNEGHSFERNGGFIVSMALCGFSLVGGLHGWWGGALTFVLFAVFRSIYGSLGCATPSATQACASGAGRAQDGASAACRRTGAAGMPVAGARRGAAA